MVIIPCGLMRNSSKLKSLISNKSFSGKLSVVLNFYSSNNIGSGIIGGPGLVSMSPALSSKIS